MHLIKKQLQIIFFGTYYDIIKHENLLLLQQREKK